jgi:Zn-dependent protease with chaperone function
MIGDSGIGKSMLLKTFMVINLLSLCSYLGGDDVCLLSSWRLAFVCLFVCWFVYYQLAARGLVGEDNRKQQQGWWRRRRR